MLFLNHSYLRLVNHSRLSLSLLRLLLLLSTLLWHESLGVCVETLGVFLNVFLGILGRCFLGLFDRLLGNRCFFSLVVSRSLRLSWLACELLLDVLFSLAWLAVHLLNHFFSQLVCKHWTSFQWFFKEFLCGIIVFFDKSCKLS